MAVGKLNPGQFPQDEFGRPSRPILMMAINNDGSFGAQAYSLAANETIAANQPGASVTRVQRGDYVLDAQFAGTSVKLQSLGADGTTWRDVTTVTTPGTVAGKISLGQDSQVRLQNPNGTSVTGVYASLS